MATTTYELTAKYMTERPGGIEQALKEAKRWATKEKRRHDETPFWCYVVEILERRKRLYPPQQNNA